MLTDNEIRKDGSRLDWLEDTHHVLCFDSGSWFCAYRGPDGEGWTDRPSSPTVRGAIDAAMEASQSTSQ